MVNRSDSHSCPSAVLVVFRNSPRLWSDAITHTHEADLVVAGANIYILLLIKIFCFLLGFPVRTGWYYVWCSALLHVRLT